MSIGRLLTALGAAAILAMPASLAAQASAMPICKDGTTSTVSGRGACSHHGGVDKAATAKAQSTSASSSSGAAASASSATSATVTCADGSTSKAGRGACSHHGGVATSGAAAATAAPAAPAKSSASPASPSASASSSSASNAGKSGTSENNDPTGAIAQCKDGLYSHAKHRQGACSRHGGVAKWMSPGA